MKRAAAGSVPHYRVHPLLRAPAEAVHQLSDIGEARVEDDPELAPGHDACAVCAGPLDDNPAACPLCESVRYCSKTTACKTQDAPSHAAVCSALRCMRQADRLTELEQKESAEPSADAAPSGEGAVSSRAQTQAVSAPSELEQFRPPVRSQDGWQYVAPDKFLCVYPRPEAQGEDDGEGQPARKRARKPDSSGAPSTSQGATAGRGARAAGTAALGSAALLPDQADADNDAQLQLASELAERTAVLSYAYTAAYALQSLPAARGAARRAESGNRPLELVVLGAAADAELGDLDSWQVVAAALNRDVRIKFVGPEVPEDLADTEEQRGRVSMRFLQRTYEARSPQSGATPDIYFAFNPGFTCPDYEWSDTVKGLARAARSPSGGGTSGSSARPCLVVATNTSMEAQMEAEWLEEYGWRADAPSATNPYTSLKLIQSGTLANDLYRKNAWLVAYEHREPQPRPARGGRGGGRRNAKAAAKRAAKALFNAMVAPVARLLRKR
ncbi:hypothetical protein PLESTB_000476700 [Pleodorina starrii]|uniref:MYND-type domain-containing protein n=1 Tax=Pleodorina starrii TaxID=330485 RepID=A0A9W6BGR5_9CHLO|nr:hypothetical protein PLESTM_001589900 [Pleodorina starrii]GLC51201.1 hypothetical protein PLESTB_000476700 [Pleodorina starrii]GLC63559.1 hypothetical protein PLESTF_000049200 [Pleodorina starrii]